MPQIRIADSETTGLEADAKVCEIGWTDLINDGDGWRLGATGPDCAFDGALPAFASFSAGWHRQST